MSINYIVLCVLILQDVQRSGNDENNKIDVPIDDSDSNLDSSATTKTKIIT